MNLDDLLFERNYDLHWQMARCERLMMAQLLKGLKPSLAIEIGTYKGGSLQVIAEYSQRVISLDANPNLKMEFSTRFPNVEFVAGFSQDTLPGIVDSLNVVQQSPEFVLVDGDHSANGVRNDINLLLGIKPQRPKDPDRKRLGVRSWVGKCLRDLFRMRHADYPCRNESRS